MTHHNESLELQVSVTFALAQDRPLFLWKIQLENHGVEPIWVEKIEFLRVGANPDFGSLDFPGDAAAARFSFFSNGWQSWSHTGAYLPGQGMRISRLGLLQQPMVVNHGTPLIHLPGYYTADFFGAVTDLTTGAGFAAGFLSQKYHFGKVEAVLFDRPSLAMYTTDRSLLDCGSTLETDWAVITPVQASNPDPLGEFLDAVAREHGLTPSAIHTAPAGWCSWYQYYSAVTANDIRANLNTMVENHHRLPLSLVQIDDGFETRTGDWLSFKKTFPGGVAPLAGEISGQGFTPGIWLAPYILDRRSTFYRNNPSYILRNRRGNPVNAGFGWNRLTAAIDLTVPGALEDTSRVVQTAASDWGFPYIKLDFLYAAALPGQRYDPRLTRAQVMRKGMQALRDAAGPQTYFLGCGLPLGSGIGLVDSMRIGADVNGTWQPQVHGINTWIKNEPHMPAARNAIQNTLSRAPMHNRWWVNDPDCLLLRPETELTDAETQTLATVIALSGGSLILSDNLTRLPANRVRMAQVLLPVAGQRPEVLDLLEEPTPRRLRMSLTGPQGAWTVAAKFNWQDRPEAWKFRPVDFGLPDEACRVSTFWNPGLYLYQPGNPVLMPEIEPHGSILLAIYPATLPLKAGYLGSDLHFTQGSEVANWTLGGKTLQLTLNLGKACSGFFRLQLPKPPARAACNGTPLPWTLEADNIYRFEGVFDSTVSVSIDFLSEQ